MLEAVIAERTAPAPEASAWREFWDAYSQSRGALIGLALVIALILLAALKSLPREPFEAAQIDASGRWRTFTHITLPMLRPDFYPLDRSGDVFTWDPV